MRNKTVPLAFINSAFLQSIDPDLGSLNLPFTITDALMAKPGVAEGVLALVRGYVEPHGLKVLALMRGRTSSSFSKTGSCAHRCWPNPPLAKNLTIG